MLGALGVEINTHGGVLEWNSTIAYDHPALVMGSDNVAYKSVRDSTNQNPTTDTGDDWLILVPAAAAVPNASTSTRGLVELATNSEAATGTDTARAVTPAGLAGADVDKVDGKHVWAGTEAEYALISSKDANTFYFRT